MSTLSRIEEVSRKVKEQMLMKGTQVASIDPVQVQTGAIEVACPVFQTLGAGYKVQLEWYGGCLDVGLWSIWSRMSSFSFTVI